MPEVIVNRSDAALATSTDGAIVVAKGPGAVPLTDPSFTYSTSQKLLSLQNGRTQYNNPTLDANGASVVTLDPAVTVAWQVGAQIVADAGGPENRPHFVVGQGIGLDGANRPIDPNKAAIRYAQEYNFWNSGGINGHPPEYTHEFHLPEVIFPPYPTGNVIRPISILVGDTSKSAQIIMGFSTLSLTDESVNSLGGINKFDGATTNFFLRSAVPSATNGNYFALSAGAVNDAMTLGRGLGATQVFMNGTSAVWNFQLSGSTKWKVGVDTGNSGQMYKIGPLQTVVEQAWAASSVSHHAFFERIRIGAATQFTAQLQLQPDATTTIGLAMKLNASQTEDSIKILDSSNATVFRVGPTGSLAVGGGANLLKHLTATATLDFPSTASGATSDLTISLTGAAANDSVILGPPASIAAGTGYLAWVSAADTVTVRFWNISGSAVDPASATFRVAILKF